ncbi:outer membrane beta-barrel protein [Vibrio metschnikovii]|uniref:Ail/Lom family outer membrane beta-barrel protein n=1 Tax=Vibrio metschnikovii TaxID=28172 RepID=UPI0013021228|nr:Ail/Lom family outer membrane beta-barrel protein [Vibrio metschnikovii]EKO3894355.1 outer membrane beta-barrel protein [Vibrio metschnikovii]
MKKVAILAAVASLLSASAFSYTYEYQPKESITVGFSHSTVRFLGEKLDDNPMGFNLKYRKDFNSEYGLITSFTYSGMNKTYTQGYLSGKLDLDYYSFTFGPTLRANEHFSVYGLLGAAHGKASADVWSLAGSASASDSETSIAYGAGLQIDVNENFTIDASFEYSKLNEVKAGTWVIGAGYRF